MMKSENKVLIVDDDFQNRFLIGEMMRAAGWETLMADNGREGVLMCMAHNPDVVITDMQMPFMNGDKMIEQIRQRRPWVKFIGITGFNDGYKIPPDVELLMKPECLRVLVQKVRELCPVTI